MELRQGLRKERVDPKLPRGHAVDTVDPVETHPRVARQRHQARTVHPCPFQLQEVGRQVVGAEPRHAAFGEDHTGARALRTPIGRHHRVGTRARDDLVVDQGISRRGDQVLVGYLRIPHGQVFADGRRKEHQMLVRDG